MKRTTKPTLGADTADTTPQILVIENKFLMRMFVDCLITDDLANSR